MQEIIDIAKNGRDETKDLLRVMRFLAKRGFSSTLQGVVPYVSFTIELSEGPMTLYADIIVESESRWLSVQGFLPVTFGPRKARNIYRAVALLNQILYPTELILIDGAPEIRLKTEVECLAGLSDDLIAQVVFPALHIAEVVSSPLYLIVHQGASVETSIKALLKPADAYAC